MKKLYADTFRWLAIGLLVTFVCGIGMASTPAIVETLLSNPIGFYGPLILQLGVCIALVAGIRKFSYQTAVILYLVYSALTGLDITFYLMIYELSSVISIFFVTALVFGIMAFIGKYLNVDVSKLGTILFVALLGVLIVPVINFFFIHSSELSLLVSCVAVVLFLGYIIYDLKIVEPMANEVGEDKASIYCAFQLYLDFINLFIRLLQFFGKRRD